MFARCAPIVFSVIVMAAASLAISQRGYTAERQKTEKPETVQQRFKQNNLPEGGQRAAKSWKASESVPEQARDILSQTGVQGGLVVHVGCGTGKLTAALRANNRYVVQGLACDMEQVARARRYIQSAAEYGPVSVRPWNGTHLPYAESTVKLLVVEDAAGLPESEMMRVLTPRGVACLKRGGQWESHVKRWPANIDEWTHCWHGPDGNPVADDSKVGPPRRIQWMSGPLWQRHHDTVPSTTAMVSANGRLFYIADLAPASLAGRRFDKWFLVARDAFSGVLLWKRPMKEWGWKAWSNTWLGRGNQPYEIAKRLVAAGDTVYVTPGFDAPLVAIDAATGELLNSYEGTEGADEILHCDGRLVLAVKNRPGKPGRKEKLVREHVCAVDAKTGELLWKQGDYLGLHANAASGDGIKCLKPFGHLELTAGDNRIFLMDEDAIVALDMESGEQQWRKPRPNVPRKWVMHWSTRSQDTCRLAYADGVLVLAQPEIEVFNPYDTIAGTLYAYSAETGDLIWKRRYGDWSHVDYQPDLFIVDGVVWVHKHLVDKDKKDYELLGIDLESGDVKRRFSTRRSFDVGHHHRCYSNRSTTKYVLSSHRGVEFLDLGSGENRLNHWVRGTCLFGYLPCNGLLYAPPDPCRCFIDAKLNGYYALSAGQGRDQDLQLPESNWERPLVKGPAFGEPLSKESSAAESWSTFRHDAGRSGAASTTVPEELSETWSVELGGQLTSPTIADGQLFISIRDRHQVAVLDAETGRRSWSFTAQAEVDTPPTLYRGLALFGARDGWVYCLRAEDGRLVWKRRIAPQDRFVGADGQMESAWPLHGSVLVSHGLAYVVAGRSSYLDGGIFACALEPRTGKVVEERNIYSPDRETGKQPYDEQHTFNIPGTLSDLLSSRDGTVYMRNEKLFEDADGGRRHVFSTAGMLDPSWFSRTKWALNGMPGAELVVFDSSAVYRIEAYGGSGKGTGQKNFFWPGRDGYLLSRVDFDQKKGKQVWSTRLPVRGKAMAVIGDRLAIAGAPNVVPPGSPLAAFEGKKGGKLWMVSTADGKPAQKLSLDSPPVWQGMAAASGHLYMADRTGIVLCLGANGRSNSDGSQ